MKFLSIVLVIIIAFIAIYEIYSLIHNIIKKRKKDSTKKVDSNSQKVSSCDDIEKKGE